MVEKQVSPTRARVSIETFQAQQSSDSGGEYTMSPRHSQQAMQKRGMSFQLSEQERAGLSSKIKSQRTTLVSPETPVSDKMRTVTEILKKMGTKVVKNDRLTPLLEKKTEMQQALQKFEQQQCMTLMEYLFHFAFRHVVTTRESGSCLSDCPDLRSSGANRREKIDQCLNQIQTVIGLCFAKIMSISMHDTLTTIGMQTPISEIDKIGDQIQLLADLYVFLVDEAPQIIRKDFVECMTQAAKDALENIYTTAAQNNEFNQFIVNAATQQRSQAQRPVNGVIPKELQLIEKVIYACVTVSSCLTEGNTARYLQRQQQLACFDADILLWNGQINIAVHRLVEHLDPVFQGDLYTLEQRHVIFDKSFLPRSMRLLLDNQEVERRGPEYSCSILHLSLQATWRYADLMFREVESIESNVAAAAAVKPEQRQQLVQFKQEYLISMMRICDQIVVKQIQFYLSAESLGIETNSLEIIQEEEEVKGSLPNSQGSDQKVDIEDFVQKEIAGPGLNFHNNSVSSNQRQSFERVKHTSANLVRDNRRINTQESLRALRLNSKPLSHVSGAQDDWLRVNFSLFKVGEVLYQRYYLQQPMIDQISSVTGYFCHLFDLYKIQLYFLMLTYRFAKYIEADSVEFFKIDFLKDMPEKTEKSEFNCTLCHTLARMFALPKYAKSRPIQRFFEEQIYQLLTLIRNHQFDPVDQNHYLKVFFLLFLQRMSIPPIDKLREESKDRRATEEVKEVSAFQEDESEVRAAEIEGIKDMRKELFVSLYMLFKIDFFPEKYLAITEDIFDTESILVIRSLVQIWHQESIKKAVTSHSHSKTVAQVFSQVNKILVQRLAFLNIVALADNDQDINKRCIDAICADLHVVFSQHGKLEGDVYVDQEVTIEMPHQLPAVTATEFKIAKDTYSSRLYMLLKLAVAIISSEPTHLDSDKAYHILYQSADPESHFISQHRHVNRTMIPVEKNQSFQGTVREPIGQDSNRGYVSAQGSLSRRNCDDCLKNQFLPFDPSPSLNPKHFEPLLSISLIQISQFSEVLHKQQLQSQQALNQNVIQANLQNNLLEKLNKLDSEHRQQVYANNRVNINRYVNEGEGPGRKHKHGQTGFKIMEKMNAMMQRFIIFVLQCKPIAKQLCKSMKKQPSADSRQSPVQQSEYQAGIEKFQKIKDKVFQLMALRNLTFNIDINSNEEEAIWPIKQMINRTLDSIQQSWSQFQVQEQATQKFLKEMEHLLNYEESKAPVPSVPRKMVKKMHSVALDSEQSGKKKNPLHRTKALGNVGQNSPFMSTKDIITKHQEASEKYRAQFKKQAEIAVSIISLYLSLISKCKKTSLLLFERKFIFELLNQLRIVIIQEGSYSLDLNDQILNAFLFEKIEGSDPLKLEQQETPVLALRYQHTINNDKLFYSSTELFQRLLTFLLQSINDQIKAAKSAVTTHPTEAVSMMIQTKNTLKTIVDRLHARICEPEDTSTTLLKFARSLTRDSINHFKKVYIFLRESVNQAENDGLELRKTIYKLNEIFVHTFSRIPQAVIMRDFFSFLREIFFYLQQMDETDHALAMDMLTILNDCIKRNSKHALTQYYHTNQSSIMHMHDSFFFSRVTPGVLLLNELQLNAKDELFMGLLFKVHTAQVQEELDLLLNVQKSSSHTNAHQAVGQGGSKQRMTIVSFMLRQQAANSNNKLLEGQRSLEIEIEVDLERRTFDLKPRLRISGRSNSKIILPTIFGVALESRGSWNFLLLHFTKQQKVELVLKNESEHHQSIEFSIKDHFPDKGATYYLALGNTVKSIHSQKQAGAGSNGEADCSLIVKDPPLQPADACYFRGRCSLPFFFQGVNDFKKFLAPNKPQQEGQQTSKTPQGKQPQSMIDTKGQAKSSRGGKDASAGGAQGQNQDISNMNMFIELLIDMIVNKKLLGHTELNMMQKFFKHSGRRQLALETVKYGFNTQGLQQDTSSKKYTLNFNSCDTLNAQVIHVHQLMVQLGCLMALKTYRAAVVFEGLGGFKNIYPLVHLISKSNLREDFGPKKPGQLLSKTFEILESFLAELPGHIQNLMNQRNLFGLLRHCLHKIGHQDLITKDVLRRLTSIVTNNVITQWQYKKDKSRTIETVIESDVENQPARIIYEEETLYEACKRHENTLRQVREMKGFYQQFLFYFTHNVLLEKQFLMQRYWRNTGDDHVAPGSDYDSSSQEQQFGRGGRVGGKLVLVKVIDMMHSICCPMSLKKAITVRQPVHEGMLETDCDNSSNSFMMLDGANDRSRISAHEADAIDGIFTNYVDLRSFIVTEKTITQLIELLDIPALTADDQIWATLEKMAQCIASSIAFLGSASANQFRDVLKFVENPQQADIPLLKMKVYLHIIAIVIEAPLDRQDSANEAKKLLSVFKELKMDAFARSLYKYYSEQNHSPAKIDEVTRLGDAIIDRAAFKKLISAGSKSKYEESKMNRTSAYSESTDSHLGKVFAETGSPASQKPPGESTSMTGSRTNRDQPAQRSFFPGPSEETKQRNHLMHSMKGQTALANLMVEPQPGYDNISMMQQRQRKLSNMETRNSDNGVYPMTAFHLESAVSQQYDQEEDDGKPSTMAQIYAKATFKKIVRRLQEDSSSIWFDHQELEMLEYEELSENYERLKQQSGGVTVQKQQQAFFEAILQERGETERQRILMKKEEQKQFAEAIENPSHLIPSYSYTIAHQKLGFVTQRRMVDRWGRMMLLMPNRKYFKGESKVYFEYHVHDYMDKMLALSLLKDEDYDDLVIPQNQYQDLLAQRMNATSASVVEPVREPAVRSSQDDTMRVDIIEASDDLIDGTQSSQLPADEATKM